MQLKDRFIKKGRLFVDMKTTVTKPVKEPDIEDPDQVHPLDAEHIARDFEDTHIRKEEGIPLPKTNEQILDEAQEIDELDEDPRTRTVTQLAIDEIRSRVAVMVMGSYIDKNDLFVPVKHLWFPKDDINEYELREGNPPGDSERPKHLQGRSIELDIGLIPDDVALEFNVRYARKLLKNWHQNNENKGLIMPTKDLIH